MKKVSGAYISWAKLHLLHVLLYCPNQGIIERLRRRLHCRNVMGNEPSKRHVAANHRAPHVARLALEIGLPLTLIVPQHGLESRLQQTEEQTWNHR